MDKKDLIKLAEEQELGQGRKVIFESSECYGFGKYLRKYAFYPSFIPLFVCTDHGPSQRDVPTYIEIESAPPVMLYHSQRLVSEWRKLSVAKSEVMLSPFVFYRKSKRIEKRIDAQGTLVFPVHSTDRIDACYDIDEYIDRLQSLPEKYHPISVCMYYKDIQNGLHEKFIRRNIDVFCAGHIYDDSFIERFYEILRNFKFTTSNHMGSYAFYSVEMDIPFFIYGKEIEMVNKGDPNCPQGNYSPVKEFGQLKKATSIFSNIKDHISPEQKRFVEDELGVKTGDGRLKMCAILYLAAFLWCAKHEKKMMIQKVKELKKKFIRLYERSFFAVSGLSKASKIYTHLTNDEKILLRTLASSLKKNVSAVEIGSYLGSSSCFIANGLSKNSVLYCIDTWENNAMKYTEDDTDPEERDTYEEFIKNTEKYSHKIRTIRKWSYDAIDDLKKEVKTIDFLFIDGDHNYDGVKKDWDLYSPLLNRGSIVVFHDTGWADGVNKVIAENVVQVAEKIKELPNMEAFRVL